jgi:hypothetical protein
MLNLMNTIYFNEYFKLFHLKGLNNLCCKIERRRTISQSYNKLIVDIATIQHLFNLCTPNFANYWTLWAFLAPHNRKKGEGVVPLLVQGLVKTINSNTTNETLATRFEYVVSWNLCEQGYVIVTHYITLKLF